MSTKTLLPRPPWLDYDTNFTIEAVEQWKAYWKQQEKIAREELALAQSMMREIPEGDEHLDEVSALSSMIREFFREISEAEHGISECLHDLHDIHLRERACKFCGEDSTTCAHCSTCGNLGCDCPEVSATGFVNYCAAARNEEPL